MSLDVSKQALAPVATRPVRISALPRANSMRILLLPDLHVPSSPRHLQLLLDNQEFLEQHDWVILLGDVTACYGTLGEYRHVRQFIEQLNRPYSVVNGNHEFCFEPADDGSKEYGHQFVRSSQGVQCELFRRFEQFYGLSSRYEAGRANGLGFCLLGVDGIGPDDQGELDQANEHWLETQLIAFEDEPLLVYSHFPLCDGRLDAIRYYQAGRKPYLLPSPAIRERLAARQHPTFWFSGHLHFAPTHPLSKPYLTDDGVWQIHCPDGRGYGRQDNELWSPQPYDDLFVRSVFIDGDTGELSRLLLSTVDLSRRQTVFVQEFDLVPSSAAACRNASTRRTTHLLHAATTGLVGSGAVRHQVE